MTSEVQNLIDANDSLKIRIMTAVDHQLYAEGLMALLTSHQEFILLGNAKTGKKLIQLLNNNLPDVIVIDVNITDPDGLEISRKIRQMYPTIKILVISDYHIVKLAKELKQIGVRGYMLKDISFGDFIKIIKKLASDEDCFFKPPGLFTKSLNNPKKDKFGKKYSLTRRELEILELIKNTNSSNSIAEKLNLSIYTVETHRKNIIHKLGVKSLTVSLFAFEDNIVF